jgi:peptidoglycan hydrolase-like protein with peptidoglycan-binding domain
MQRIARGALVLTVFALLVPWTASAATTPTTPVAGHLSIDVVGAYGLGSKNVTVTGRSMLVEGVATPFVAGQVATVDIWQGRRRLKSETVKLRRSRSGTHGHFSIRFGSGSPGNVKITAVHAATPEELRAVAKPRKVDVVVPTAGPGFTGTFVSLIQSRLAALHYAVPQNGVYDQLTANAILAYRKVRGWARIFTLDSSVIRGLLNGVGTFQVRYPRQGRHVEANLTDQTLALINGSKVVGIYPVSSGKPSTPTVLGTYHVYLRTPGFLPDGMYYSSFFTGGYAIHGYDPSPTYPASHGCLRLPLDDAIQVYNWITYGTPVDVYYGAN